MEKHYFDCQCECGEHFIRFVLDDVTGDLWTETYLRPKLWFVRIWYALLYVFGKRSTFGDFDCIFFKDEDKERLRLLLTRAIETRPERPLMPLLGPKK